jgi:hypothetical protein
MATACRTPYTPEYHAQFETRFNGRTKLRYYRYVIVTDEGNQLFDGYAGDMKEASITVNAHLSLLRARCGMSAREPAVSRQ